MANKKRKNELQQANQRKAKAQQYDAATKNLFIFPCIALGLSILVFLLLFVSFADVYNNTAGVGVEVKVSGWSFIVASLTGEYSSADAVYGNLAVPFYFYAGEWCETLATVALIALFVMVFNLIIQVVTVVRKFYTLNIVSAVLSFASAILLIVCFAEGLAMKNGAILSDYCGGNPACSIRSFAIFPALVALGNCAVSLVAAFKYMKASALLK